MTSVNVGDEYDLSVLQGNDYTEDFSFSAGSYPFNLTGSTLAFYLKASDTATDESGYTNTPSVVSDYLGEISVTIPDAQLATSETLFYHIDATDSGLVTTLVFGYVTILPI
jgi:hypothetical protein